jgi:hypothetical protein
MINLIKHKIMYCAAVIVAIAIYASMDIDEIRIYRKDNNL